MKTYDLGRHGSLVAAGQNFTELADGTIGNVPFNDGPDDLNDLAGDPDRIAVFDGLAIMGDVEH